MSEENKTVFDLNDRVSAFGLEGIVLSIKDDAYYPIYVEFDNKHYAGFTKDGKYQCWHLEPSLKLIEKAKRKVKKKFWLFIHESEIDKLYLEAATLYTMKPNKNCKNCHLVELELEVEE